MTPLQQTDLFGQPCAAPVARPRALYGVAKVKCEIGYREAGGDHCCGACAELQAIRYHGKLYHKCRHVGNSHGAATDVQLKNTCDKWRAL